MTSFCFLKRFLCFRVRVELGLELGLRLDLRLGLGLRLGLELSEKRLNTFSVKRPFGQVVDPLKIFLC